WSIVGADHIVRFAQEAPKPVRLTGRIVDRPAIFPRSQAELPASIPRFDRTLCVLECTSLISGETVQSVSGRARLEIDGQWLQGATGDEVEVLGILSRPGGPRNPGAFDFRRYLRADGLLVTVRCGEPEDVRITRSRGSSFRRMQAGLRTRAERMLEGKLSER